MNETVIHVAGEDKVWDFKDPHYQFNWQTMQEEQIHLYTNYLQLGYTDSIDNYIEVDDPYKN